MSKKKTKRQLEDATKTECTNKLSKRRLDITSFAPLKHPSRSTEEIEKAFDEAVKKHPFHDNADHIIDFHGASVFRDAKGAVCGVLLPGALPAFAAAMAADVLRPAAVRTSLRSNMFGGLAPLSGIAGYFDYRGSPVELKCRKTTFTCEHLNTWPDVFPMITYIDAIYKAVFPKQWAMQHAAVPDIVRIHGSSFSTLTINQQFRTASHTDAGDFDAGYGLLSVLEGEYQGVSLALDDFRVCFCMQPGDVLLFNTHFFHSNTEPELDNHGDKWTKLTCVFYYRAALGEPFCIAEYRRRLLRAKELGASPPPVVDEIVQKDNGDNFNKPAATFPPSLTPFGGAAGICSLENCAPKLLRLHELLLEQPMLSLVLFGEPLQTDDGIPQRQSDQLISVHLPVVLKLPYSGGFSETSGVLQAAKEKQYFFEKENLESQLGGELVAIWSQNRALWLKLVREEWERLCKRDPERVDFSWRNHSPMNDAFFDLCEVGKQVLLGILDKETATNAEEHSFWILFAAHLCQACVTENNMPQDAISMRKLNVKLKDFHFGGTRYLKDMPPEEQKRRLERKRHIEEVRRRKGAASVTPSSSWLQNDSFDYQFEDKEIDFEKNGWISPEENVKRIGLKACGNAAVAADVTDPISVLVVLPRPVLSSPADVPYPEMNEESQRLLMNPAAQRLLATAENNGGVHNSPLVFGGVTITVVFHDDDTGTMDFDFIILQHVLSAIKSDNDAEACVDYWSSRARHGVFVVETDLLDRRHFLLLKEVQDAYLSVAGACFRKLHAAAYSRDLTYFRTTPSLIALVKPQNVGIRYKFSGSPLNSVAILVIKNV